MRTISGSALAAAVSNANALGFFGAGFSLDEPAVKQDLDATPALLPAENGEASTLPFGIGFLIFKASLPLALEATKLHRPAAVWFFAHADSEQLREWVREFRDVAPWTKVLVQISSVAEAAELLELGVDAIVAQGVADSGGHGRKAGGSILTLVPEVKDLVKKMGRVVPVLAAGGIMDGRGAAAALALGADGIVLGTRVGINSF
jgi:nitronate monooxygenase